MGDTAATLVERALEGDRRSIAKVLSLVEQGGDDARYVIATLHPLTTNTKVIPVQWAGYPEMQSR